MFHEILRIRWVKHKIGISWMRIHEFFKLWLNLLTKCKIIYKSFQKPFYQDDLYEQKGTGSTHITSDTQQSSKSHGKPDNVFVTQALTFWKVIILKILIFEAYFLNKILRIGFLLWFIVIVLTLNLDFSIYSLFCQ